MLNVLLCYKNFKKWVPGCSHIGLGNNAIFTARVLKQHGVRARPVGVLTTQHIAETIAAEKIPVTHVVVEGTWLPAGELETLAVEHHDTEFAVREHSQVSFLQCQRGGIDLFRAYGYVVERCLNFALHANSQRFAAWWTEAYDQPCRFIPNLYPMDGRPATQRRRAHDRDVLRVSGYGAGRVLKNLTTAAAAALVLGRRLARQIEFHINVGREPGLESTTRGVRALFKGVPYAKLIEDAWCGWGEFRHSCAAMDVALAPTFTETFCLTAADHVVQGVPVVGTDAVEWLPKSWLATADDVESVADVAQRLVLDPHANEAGVKALAAYQADAVKRYLGWLGKWPGQHDRHGRH